MIDLVEYAKTHTEDEVAIFRRSSEKTRAAMVSINDRAGKQAVATEEALERVLAAIPSRGEQLHLLKSLEAAAAAAADKCSAQVFATFAFDPGNDGRVLNAMDEWITLQHQFATMEDMRRDLEKEIEYLRNVPAKK